MVREQVVARMHKQSPMTVFELATASIIGRQKLKSYDELCAILADWFQRPVSHVDVVVAITRMERLGWLEANGAEIFDCRLTDTGIETVTFLYGGCIRMIDRGLGIIKASYLTNLLGLTREPRDE